MIEGKKHRSTRCTLPIRTYLGLSGPQGCQTPHNPLEALAWQSMVAAVLRKPQRIMAAPSSASRAVALSFSGGGLIAAAYHLGVYQGLTLRGAELLDARTAPLV